jgi:hypothetical protein
LTTDRELGNASIQLFDVQGKLHHDIRTTIHPGNTSITIPQLTRGIYFLQVSTPEYISSQKIWLH